MTTYESYQQTLRSMGIEDVVRVRQTAYERYLETLQNVEQ